MKGSPLYLAPSSQRIFSKRPRKILFLPVTVPQALLRKTVGQGNSRVLVKAKRTDYTEARTRALLAPPGTGSYFGLQIIAFKNVAV